MRRALAAVLTLVALAVLPATAGALPNHERHPLSVGHVDAVAPEIVDGRLVIKVHDDSGAEPVERDPADVLLHVKPEAAMTVPDMSTWSFLGPAGATVYYLPQTQNPDLLWPGWSSEQIAHGVLQGDQLTWRLLSVSGPGAFHLFGEGVFGDPIPVLSRDSGWPNSATMGSDVHAHYSWTFAERGLYRIVFEVSATLADGTPVSSGPVEYRAFVGDLADLPAETTDLTVAGLAGEYRVGDTISLTAVQNPSIGLDHYHWFTRCAGAADWSVVAGTSGAALQLTAEAAHDGCQVQARLYGAGHAVVAASAPVTLHVATPQDVVPPGGGDQPPPESHPAPPVQPPSGGTPPRRAPARPTATLRGREVAVRTLVRTGRARVQCRLSGAGRCTVEAWVGRATARKLGLRVRGKATRLVLGRGRASRRSAGSVRVTVTVNARARAALRGAGRSVPLRLTASGLK